MTPKISIIIPVYNVEKYLRECLDSCIHQTLHEIEIICVNDCSPDNSQKILEEYAEKDNRISIIVHQVNLGLGGARNTGIVNASGEYIWFVDSDDFISENACQLLYDTAKQYDLDVLCFNAIPFYDNADGRKQYVESDYYTEWAINTMINPQCDFVLTKGHYPVTAWCYITKTSFVQSFRFREHCYYEDTDWTPILFAASHRLRCIVFSAYHRRITPGSITQSEMTERKFCDMIAVVKSLEHYAKDNKISHKSFFYQFYLDYYYYRACEARQLTYSNDIIREFIADSQGIINKYNLMNFVRKIKFVVRHPFKTFCKIIFKSEKK